MTQEHPITPPPELVQQWLNAPRYAKSPKDGTFVVQKCHSLSKSEVIALVENAARWGADQELEACCAWLPKLPPWSADDLRRHRRPKPPSLKAGAIEVLDELDGLFELPAGHYNTILRALEQLDDSL